MPSSPPILDQAYDPFESYFRPTVELYDEYQLHQYERNYKERAAAWHEHFLQMQDTLLKHILRFLEKSKVRLRDMNFAVVGPGRDPAARDFGPLITSACLAQMRYIVMIDFSRLITQAAVDSLVRTGIDRKKCPRMHFDVTNGLSTVYRAYIEEVLSGVKDEDGMSRALESIERDFSVQMLDDRLTEALCVPRGTGDDLHREMGGEDDEPVNRKRTLALTMQGQPVPLDLVSVNMVVAGTGAAAESLIWQRYQQVMKGREWDTLKRGDEMQRRKNYEAIHDMISQYNTAIAADFIVELIAANPGASVLVMTDVSTVYNADDYNGLLDRLDVRGLVRELRKRGVYAKPDDTTWKWRDEPNHHHGVQAIRCEKFLTHEELQKKEEAAA